MIDQTIITELKERHGKYDFKTLISYMELSGFKFENKGLKGPVGLTTIDGVILDMSKLSTMTDRMLYYVVLHEMAHMKRIDKFGVETVLDFLSIEDFEEFHGYLVREEVLADRFASRMFFCFNSNVFQEYETQQLHLRYNQDKYQRVSRLFHDKVKNKKENYYDLLKLIVIE